MVRGSGTAIGDKPGADKRSATIGAKDVDNGVSAAVIPEQPATRQTSECAHVLPCLDAGPPPDGIALTQRSVKAGASAPAPAASARDGSSACSATA